ncbi:MAG: acyl--CoA ligase, partial [Planctomycetales bacterium]|nr:acyl--CoA ligase [Planctomycetales bacterium]
AALAALDHVGTNVFLLDSGTTQSEIDELANVFQLRSIVRIAGQSKWTVEKREVAGADNETRCVTILTSGTTGRPKAARHTWESLSRPVATLRQPIDRSESKEQSRWLLTYRPQLYAGLQVVLHAFADRGVLVVLDDGASPQDIVQLMRDQGVGFVSATPSFWRGILLAVDETQLHPLQLKQITLGGELVDQGLLNSLKRVFDEARIIHIYATTELGKCFSVTDGFAGFPESFLHTELPGGVRLKVEDGRLYVRSKNKMQNYDPLGSRLVPEGTMKAGDTWFDTRDLVEIEGDRVFFVGRESDIINVGGYKVNPTKVEAVVRQVTGIGDARVFGQTSSVTGQIVACDIVLDDDVSAETTMQAIRELAAKELDRYHVPRIINVVDEIKRTSAGKTRRTE